MQVLTSRCKPARPHSEQATSVAVEDAIHEPSARDAASQTPISKPANRPSPICTRRPRASRSNPAVFRFISLQDSSLLPAEIESPLASPPGKQNVCAKRYRMPKSQGIQFGNVPYRRSIHQGTCATIQGDVHCALLRSRRGHNSCTRNGLAPFADPANRGDASVPKRLTYGNIATCRPDETSWACRID